jgi:hypothetical protein
MSSSKSKVEIFSALKHQRKEETECRRRVPVPLLIGYRSVNFLNPKARHDQNILSDALFYPTMDLTLNLSFWSISSIVLGLAVVLPIIMGFFKSNKFDVNGKVR